MMKKEKKKNLSDDDVQIALGLKKKCSSCGTLFSVGDGIEGSPMCTACVIGMLNVWENNRRKEEKMKRERGWTNSYEW